MKQPTTKTKLSDLAALLVLGVFALCVLLVLLTGADVYGKLVDRGQGDYTRRTATQYIATRIHQADQGAVTLENFAGQEALVLWETIGGSSYLTRVYCYEGWLWELFTAEGGNFSPEDGQRLLEAETLSFSLENGLLKAEIGFSDGITRELVFHLRNGEGVVP